MSADKQYRRLYPSLADLCAHAVNDESELKKEHRASRRGSDGYGLGSGTEWSGATWESASKTALRGDIEGARRLSPKVLAAVNAMMGKSPRLDPVYRLDEGRWIDVARYVKGEPECWGDMVESDPAPRKGASIIVNVAASAGVSADDLDKCGVAIGSAILGLQAQGYAVTLYAAEKIGGHGMKYSHLTVAAPVNPGGVPLDVAAMSVILRPWFLRRIMFSLEETFPHDIRSGFGIEYCGGYGTPARLTQADALAISGQKNAVLLDMNYESHQPQDIAPKIIRQIKGE